MALLDVVGYNYAFARYESDHIKYPNRIMVGTETNPPRALENWQLVKKLPYVIGYFVWTATDNLGEAGVGVPQLRDINAVVPANAPADDSGARDALQGAGVEVHRGSRAGVGRAVGSGTNAGPGCTGSRCC